MQRPLPERPRLEAFLVENMDERQSIRKIAVLVGGGLKPLRISDKAEAPQGPLPRHESTRNRLPGPCGVCRSLSSRLPAVRSSFVELGALHANRRADSCRREDVRVLRGPALGGLHAGRKTEGLEEHPVPGLLYWLYERETLHEWRDGNGLIKE